MQCAPSCGAPEHDVVKKLQASVKGEKEHDKQEVAKEVKVLKVTLPKPSKHEVKEVAKAIHHAEVEKAKV
jgi:hypothetical protein